MWEDGYGCVSLVVGWGVGWQGMEGGCYVELTLVTARGQCRCHLVSVTLTVNYSSRVMLSVNR